MIRRVKGIIWFLAAVCAIACALIALFHTAPRFTAGAIESATVLRVVDGDTLDVESDGAVVKVRLKGVDTPENVHPDESRNTGKGAVASDYTKSAVQPGSTVWLQRDTRGDDADRYGRSLRYVWLAEPDTSRMTQTAYVAENMLQGKLLASGNAQVYAYFGEVFDYRPQFEAISHGL